MKSALTSASKGLLGSLVASAFLVIAGSASALPLDMLLMSKDQQDVFRKSKEHALFQSEEGLKAVNWNRVTTPADLRGLSLADIGKLTPAHVGQMRKELAQVFDAARFDALSDMARMMFPYEHLSLDVFKTLKPVNIPAVAIAALPIEMVEVLNVEDPSRFWSNVPGIVIKRMSDAQVKTILKIVYDHNSSLDPKAQGNKWLPANSTAAAALDDLRVSIQSPADIKAMTPQQINGWKRNSLRLLTSEQLAALSGEQINGLELEKLDGLSDALLKGLSAVQLAKIDAKHMNRLYKRLSDEQVKLIPVGLFKDMSVATIFGEIGLKGERFKLIPAEVTKAAFEANLGNFPRVSLRMLSKEMIQAIPLAKFENGFWGAWPAEAFNNMSHEQLRLVIKTLDTLNAGLKRGDMMYLPADQDAEKAINSARVRVLTEDDIKALTPKQVNAWTDIGVASINSRQFAALTGEQINGLDLAKLEKLPKDVVKGMNDSQIAKVDALHMNWLYHLLPFDRIKLIPIDTVKKMDNWEGSLTVDIVKAFTKDQVKALADAFAFTGKSLGNNKSKESILAAFKAAATGYGLPDPYSSAAIEAGKASGAIYVAKVEDIRQWKFKEFMDYRAGKMTDFTPEMVGAVRPDIFAALAFETKGGPEILGSLTAKQLSGLRGRQIGALGSKGLKLLKDPIPKINANAVNELARWQEDYPNTMQLIQLGLLADDVFKGLVDQTLKALVRDNFINMTAEKWALFSSAQVATMSPSFVRFDFLTKTQLSDLTTKAFGSLPYQQAPNVAVATLEALSGDQWRGIGKAAAFALTGKQLNALSVATLQKIPPTTIAFLDPKALAELTLNQGNGLTDLQLNSLDLDQGTALVSGNKLGNDRVLKLTEYQKKMAPSGTGPAAASIAVIPTDPAALKKLSEAQIAMISSKESLGKLTAADAAAFLPENIEWLSAPLQAGGKAYERWQLTTQTFIGGIPAATLNKMKFLSVAPTAVPFLSADAVKGLDSLKLEKLADLDVVAAFRKRGMNAGQEEALKKADSAQRKVWSETSVVQIKSLLTRDSSLKDYLVRHNLLSPAQKTGVGIK